MPRYKVILEYDGTYFSGWQRQRHASSVQQVLEEALLIITKRHVTIFAAGRTDAGVHAIGQVAHFDLDVIVNVDALKKSLNYFIKPHVSIIELSEVYTAFHSRFDAKKKQYIYKIISRDSHLALMQKKAWLVKSKITINDMQEASEVLIGRNDFTSFRSSACQAKSPIKTLDSIQIIQDKYGVIELIFEGRSFLHNQVRIMSSALKNIGVGKWSYQKLKDVLVAQDRRYGPETAPPYGLYLSKIWYDE